MKKKLLKYSAIGFLLGGLFGAGFGGLFGVLLGGLLGAALGAALGHRADVHSDLFKKINVIRSEIKDVLADENKTIKSKHLIEKWLREKLQPGITISQNNVDVIFSVASAYVQRTPDLMEALFRAAKWSNLENEIIFLLQTLSSYFGDSKDLIPGESGIAGRLDDAYVTQHLIEKLISWQGGILAHAAEKNVDLYAGNAFVAALLPANITMALNQKVEQAIGASETRQMLNRMLQQSAALQASWNRASQGIDWKKEIIKDEIYSDLAKDGIYLRPTG